MYSEDVHTPIHGDIDTASSEFQTTLLVLLSHVLDPNIYGLDLDLIIRIFFFFLHPKKEKEKNCRITLVSCSALQSDWVK